MAWRDRVNTADEVYAQDLDAHNPDGSGWEIVSRELIHYTQTKVFQPDPQTLEKSRVLYDGSEPHVVHAYKLLRTKTQRLLEERGWNCVAMLGGRSRDGATLSAINLAISLAMDPRHTVLLVDMNLRQPSIHQYFGYVPDVGITDVLAGRCKLADALVCPGLQGLSVLPGNRSIRNSSEVLASHIVNKLVSELESRYPERIILFDLPPVLEAEDALVFDRHYDAGILVLREGISYTSDMIKIAEALGDKPLLGTILNGSSV